MQSDILVLIVGPTAVGKTEFSIQLAERLEGEIVSADSRLFYRGMDIGTAKPSVEERSRIPHHLIDIAGPEETLSLAVFQEMARKVIGEIHARGRLPILVGGTGQYIRAVTQGWKPPEVESDIRLRNVLERIKEEGGVRRLHAALSLLDPDAAEKIDARNFRRTIRALEVILKTGRRFSEQRVQKTSSYRLITIGLKRAREQLYARLDARIDAMFAGGFVDEVRKLLDAGFPPTLPSMSAIGYRECVRVVRDEMTIDEAKRAMRRATRIFVRRQANWFKESDPGIAWFDAGDARLIDRVELHIRDRIGESHHD